MGIILEKLVLPAGTSTYDKCLPYLKFIPRNDCEFVPIAHYILDEELPTILMAHGNNNDIGNFDIVNMAKELGVNICIFDYSGYGIHSCRETSEENCHLDALAVYNYLIKSGTKEIVLYGYSIGTAVIAWLAWYISKKGECKHKVILVSAFKSIMNALFFMSLPGDVFKTKDLVTCIKCPILFIHGCNDYITPYKSALQLSEEFSNLYKFETIHGCGHADIMNNPQHYEAIKEFIHG